MNNKRETYALKIILFLYQPSLERKLDKEHIFHYGIGVSLCMHEEQLLLKFRTVITLILK